MQLHPVKGEEADKLHHESRGMGAKVSGVIITETLFGGTCQGSVAAPALDNIHYMADGKLP